WVEFRLPPDLSHRFLSSGHRSINQPAPSRHASWIFRGTTTTDRGPLRAREGRPSGAAAARLFADWAAPSSPARRPWSVGGGAVARSTFGPRRGGAVLGPRTLVEPENRSVGELGGRAGKDALG